MTLKIVMEILYEWGTHFIKYGWCPDKSSNTDLLKISFKYTSL